MELTNIINYLVNITDRRIVIICTLAIAFDIVTGYLKAIKFRKLNSSVSRDGYLKKLTWPIALLLGFAFKYFLNVDLIFYISASVCFSTEIISIAENLCEVNPKLNIFRKYLEKIELNKKEEK